MDVIMPISASAKANFLTKYLVKYFFVSIYMSPKKTLFSLPICVVICSFLLLITACTTPKSTRSIAHINNWDELTNPVIQLNEMQLPVRDIFSVLGLDNYVTIVASEQEAHAFCQCIATFT